MFDLDSDWICLPDLHFGPGWDRDLLISFGAEPLEHENGIFRSRDVRIVFWPRERV